MSSSRRGFLLRLVAVPLAGWLPKPVVGGAEAVRIHECHVAGFRFHHGPELIQRMRVGHGVLLATEPGNAHDPFAVRVEYGGWKIGYLPRDQNQPVARLLWGGTSVRARILAVDEEAEPWRAVRIGVELLGLRSNRIATILEPWSTSR